MPSEGPGTRAIDSRLFILTCRHQGKETIVALFPFMQAKGGHYTAVALGGEQRRVAKPHS